jgi:hypothetical protein
VRVAGRCHRESPGFLPDLPLVPLRLRHPRAATVGNYEVASDEWWFSALFLTWSSGGGGGGGGGVRSGGVMLVEVVWSYCF